MISILDFTQDARGIMGTGRWAEKKSRWNSILLTLVSGRPGVPWEWTTSRVVDDAVLGTSLVEATTTVLGGLSQIRGTSKPCGGRAKQHHNNLPGTFTWNCSCAQHADFLRLPAFAASCLSFIDEHRQEGL